MRMIYSQLTLTRFSLHDVQAFATGIEYLRRFLSVLVRGVRGASPSTEAGEDEREGE